MKIRDLLSIIIMLIRKGDTKDANDPKRNGSSSLAVNKYWRYI